MVAAEFHADFVDGDAEAFVFLMRWFAFVRALRTDRVVSTGCRGFQADPITGKDFCR
jgi:hypothetical protein